MQSRAHAPQQPTGHRFREAGVPLCVATIMMLTGCGSSTLSGQPATRTAPSTTSSVARSQTNGVLPVRAGTTLTASRVHQRASIAQPREPLRLVRGRHTFRVPGAHGPPQTEPDGSVIIPPAAPRQDAQRSSDECVKLEQQAAKRRKRTTVVPPAPGLQAKLSGKSIVVTFDTGDPPRT
jgi:hypothetical protein